METPICDFVRAYAENNSLRLHMPGHKGIGPLGVETLDITEISGADSLYEAQGIIRQSEENASTLFGAKTFYSAEGSSLCIRAMLCLVAQYAREQGKRPRILAGRNAHKSFLTAAALLDVEVDWLYPAAGESYLSCTVDASRLSAAFDGMLELPTAVYLTAPDYLGHLPDLAPIAALCRKKGVLLLVDNAHGAYLKFLPQSRHPMDLGADLCCDSAHKTLPVLTGGAYLHVSPKAPDFFADGAKRALALFGSTSPSYLILQSLDACNRYLEETYRDRLAAFAVQADALKGRLAAHGYTLSGNEPLKLTIRSKPYGYCGTELAEALEQQGIVCEFADEEHLVLMLTPEIGKTGLARLEQVLFAVPVKTAQEEHFPAFHPAEVCMSFREAVFAPSETIPAAQSAGRILSAVTTGCPPAVPIVMCGERIAPEHVAAFAHYGLDSCVVIKE